jgi:hypothetical protein
MRWRNAVFSVAQEDILAHTNQAIIGGNHKKAIIRFAAEEPKYCGSEISFVPRQVSKADDFGL